MGRRYRNRRNKKNQNLTLLVWNVLSVISVDMFMILKKGILQVVLSQAQNSMTSLMIMFVPCVERGKTSFLVVIKREQERVV